MREIKFRAWYSTQNKMEYDPYADEFVCEGTPLNQAVKAFPDGVVLMQYTGLKDTNGKEIYEGDICNTPDGVRLVRYDAPSFWLLVKEDDIVDVDSFSTPSVLEEVIGNIYENPQLLHKEPNTHE